MRAFGQARSHLHAALLSAATLLGACSQAPVATTPEALSEVAPSAATCPSAVASIARCLSGRDSAGAYYLIAVPNVGNGHLVMHAHGGPSLGAPTPDRAEEDLVRWAIMVKAGYAWAGSTFRQGGVAVRAAAQDTERLRRIFNRHVAVPRRTVLHGQSWGASVAAKGAEMFTAQTSGQAGTPPYDAVLLTSGVLAGGTRSYDFRLDLRVVYQHLCNNHPRPEEAAYALSIGLPQTSALTSKDLSVRVNECLGLDKRVAQRTAEQQRKVQTIVRVIRIPEGSIQAHLNWGTFLFRDISRRLDGKSPFGNIGVNYTGAGSPAEDAALNLAVMRYRADAVAVARFGEDTDPTGRIPVPVLTVKGIHDPTAFVELDTRFKETMTKAGSADRLVQTFADFDTHSYLSDVTYPALMTELLQWAEQGVRPTPSSVALRCSAMEGSFGVGCKFLPDHVPATLETRVPARERP